MMWTATALVFSGRPDPTWPLDEALARAFLDAWEGAAPAEGAPFPALGYRGVALAGPGGERYRAFEGTLTRESPGVPEAREDAGRAVERRLLAAAPAGALPPGLVD